MTKETMINDFIKNISLSADSAEHSYSLRAQALENLQKITGIGVLGTNEVTSGNILEWCKEVLMPALPVTWATLAESTEKNAAMQTLIKEVAYVHHWNSHAKAFSDKAGKPTALTLITGKLAGRFWIRTSAKKVELDEDAIAELVSFKTSLKYAKEFYAKDKVSNALSQLATAMATILQYEEKDENELPLDILPHIVNTRNLLTIWIDQKSDADADVLKPVNLAAVSAV